MIMMDAPTNDLERMEESVHDQLPSVEEYKVGVGFKKSPTFRSQRPDPVAQLAPSFTEATDLEQVIAAEKEEEEEDELIVHRPFLCSSTKFIAWVIVVVVAVVVVGVVVGTRNQSASSFWWIRDSDRYQRIQQYLIDAGVSKTNDLVDPNSPQHLAAQWMAHKDGMKLQVPKVSTGRDHLMFVERYVLVVLYYATGGPNWTHQLNWLSDNHLCTWYQAFVLDNDEETLDGGYIALGVHGCKLVEEEEDNLVPFTLFLRKYGIREGDTQRIRGYETCLLNCSCFVFNSTANNGLDGTLPLELEYLDRIEILNIPFNTDLRGTLPEALSKMDALTHLGLQWCGFTGTIPTWIGSLSSLDYLGLGNNQFTGSVPQELDQLTTLKLLGLDDNMLSANIELFHALKAIKSLYLEDNQITGTISEALMASWPDLEELDLSNNALTKTLPDNFFNHFNNLRVVDLHRNKFDGPLPNSINENSDLEFLALHDNRFDEKVPAELINFKALKHLDLSGNNFISTLPEVLGEMTQLHYLFVGKNAFESGTIPKFLIELTNLRELSFKNAQLTGEIPEFIHYLSKLEVLDLRKSSRKWDTALGVLSICRSAYFPLSCKQPITL
jgi:Ran GTPase-activating protein (RanGAP) involved in mRNA processing and transport